ncbi:MAG TPA: FAD-binding protein, partial [Acidimicrobiales bacterium]|nr:FAD-binding protein [Acidimicrobiales bacterium]
MSETFLSGWGRTGASKARVVTPRSLADLETLFASETTLIARGLGRSYGDAAQLAGGVVLDNRGFAQLGPVSPEGLVRLGAGVSFDELLARTIPLGW